jgi:hypothetical protein
MCTGNSHISYGKHPYIHDKVSLKNCPLPVKMTSPLNFLHRPRVISKPMPLFDPVTCQNTVVTSGLHFYQLQRKTGLNNYEIRPKIVIDDNDEMHKLTYQRFHGSYIYINRIKSYAQQSHSRNDRNCLTKLLYFDHASPKFQL